MGKARSYWDTRFISSSFCLAQFSGPLLAQKRSPKLHVFIWFLWFQTLEQEKAELEVDKEEGEKDAQAAQKEQDDLLVLLSDQEAKLKEYRKRLKELGEEVGENSKSLVLWKENKILLLTTLTSGPNLCMIAAENAAPANNRR